MDLGLVGLLTRRGVTVSTQKRRAALRKLLIEGLEDRRVLASVTLTATPTTIFEGGLVTYQSSGVPGPESGFTRIDYVVAIESNSQISSILFSVNGQIDAYYFYLPPWNSANVVAPDSFSSNINIPQSKYNPTTQSNEYSGFIYIDAIQDEAISIVSDINDASNDVLQISMTANYLDSNYVSQSKTKNTTVTIIDDDSTQNEKITLTSTDSSAAEPHSIYYIPESPVDKGHLKVTVPAHWNGGSPIFETSGTATFGSDYSYGISTIPPNVPGVVLTPIPNTNQFSLTIPVGITSVEIDVNPLSDSEEIDDGETATLKLVPDQKFVGNPANYTITAAGTGTVTIADENEGLHVYPDPDSTEEYRAEESYAKFHVRPNKTGVLMAGFAFIRIYATARDDAQPGADYSLKLPNGTSLVINSTSTPNVYESQSFSVDSLSEFLITVIPVSDKILEGNEKIRVRLFAPPSSISPRDFGEATVTIQEKYYDEKIEIDERSGCSCTCMMCSDGSLVTVNPESGSGSIGTADGYVSVRLAGQQGTRPVVNVGLNLPVGKVVPTKIEVQLQVIEKDLDANGNVQGLGRKLAAQNAVVSPVVSLDVPTTAVAGNTIWFSVQADLSKHMKSWQTSGLDRKQSSGVTEQIIPIEVLAHPTFPATKANNTLVKTEDIYSGWVGHFSHAVTDESSSAVSKDLGRNNAPTGVDRLIRDHKMLVPDLPANGGSSGGKVKTETGSMLFRSDGTVSWFKQSSTISPGTQNVLSGDYVTNRYGDKTKFNANGEMTQRIDISGNITYFDYSNGELIRITDPRGMQTTFTSAIVNGLKTMTIVTVNSTTDASKNTTRTLTWNPSIANGKLTVVYDDPDGAGPRSARANIFTYNTSGSIEIKTGEVSNPTHTTLLNFANAPGGDGRLTSILYPDGSSLTLDLPRQRNSLISSTYVGGPILISDPRACRVDTTTGTGNTSTNPIPNYTIMTRLRSPNSAPQRTISQLDHRGRVLRTWDPNQVDALRLASNVTSWGQSEFLMLQANIDLSHEYSRTATRLDRESY